MSAPPPLGDEPTLSELTLREIAEGICLIGAADGRILYANLRFEQLFGYAPGELEGKALHLLDARGERGAERIAATLAQQREGELYLRNRRKDGRLLWTRARVTELRHPGLGRIWIAVQQDLGTVEEEHAWTRSLVDEALTAMVISDGAGHAVANRRALELMGLRPQDRLRWRLLTPTGRPLAERELPLYRALCGESVRGEELFIETPGGARHPILVNGEAVRNRAGKLIGAVVTWDDLSAIKRNEAQLRLLARSSDLLARSLDYRRTLDRVVELVVPELADCCVALTLEEGHLTPAACLCREPGRRAAVEALLSEFAQERADYGAGWVVRTLEPELVVDLTRERRRALARNPHELALFKQIGAVSYLTVPLLAHGRPLGAITLFTTGSRHLRPEDVPLVLAVAGRAALAIENARLFRAAAGATRARDEVIGVVAHDLRNPLTAIKLVAGTLAKKASAEDRQRLEMVLRSVEQMNRLIQDLLDVMKIEAGRLTVARRPVEVQQLLAEAAEEARPMAQRVDLTLTPPAQPLVVVADRLRILQVLSNLLGNAFKFTPPGGHVQLWAEAHGSEVRFAVRDTGPGIAPAQQPHIFERFYQGEASDRRGAGLGLPICKGIVEAHGGRIWAESQLGRGTTLHFALPRWHD